MDELYDGFIEKTDYLTETKGLLKDRINSLGGSITSGTTFRDYLVWLDSLYETLDGMTITGLPDSLEGKCEQEGTPTPTSPQPINITTGRQVVSTQQGNQLFNKNNPKILNAKYGATITADNNERMLYIPCKPNTTYTLYHIATTPMRNSIATSQTLPEIGTTLENGVYSSTSPKTITTNANAKYLVWQFYAMNDTTHTLQQVLDSIMINEGNTALPYEEYKGNDYEINLGKNLFETMSSSTSQGVTLTPNSDGSYTLNGKTTGVAIFNKTLTTQLPPGTYTVSYESSVPLASDFFVRIRKANGTMLVPNGIPSQVVGNNTTANKTTFTSTDYGAIVAINLVTTGVTYNNVNVKIQLEKGSQTSYSPYKTPIYLGEMRNTNNVVIAKDYIFRNTTENPLYDSNLEEGQWYIHKEIGRVVLNGSDTTFSGISGTRNTGYSRFYVSVPNPLRQPSNVVGKVMCNRLVAGTLDDTYLGNEAITSWDSGDRLYLYINDIATYNLNNANTWLQTHNLVICYALATPTNTLIEDEELINQLNEIDIFTVISEDFYN